MNCWTCRYQRIGGHLTFLGFCGWFETNGRERKAIPASVVDQGCPKLEPRGEQEAA